jgi:hypothetical protein
MRMVCLQQILASFGVFLCIFASSVRLDRAATLQRWDDGNILNPAADRTLIMVFYNGFRDFLDTFRRLVI